MSEQSLDPRINRFHLTDETIPINGSETTLQLQEYEVFQKTKLNKPWESVGTIHSSGAEMALLFAKEQYTRRGNTFAAIAVAPVANITLFGMAGLAENMFTNVLAIPSEGNNNNSTDYEVFFQKKRGKFFFHLCNTSATSALMAAQNAANNNFTDPCSAVWVIKSTDFVQTTIEEGDIWETLPEKKYREVIMYKALDKINAYKARQNNIK